MGNQPKKGATGKRPGRDELYQVAQGLVQAKISFVPVGKSKLPCFSLLPVKRDEEGNLVLDSKTERPKRTWDPFKAEIPSKEYINEWFKPSNARTRFELAVLNPGCVIPVLHN